MKKKLESSKVIMGVDIIEDINKYNVYPKRKKPSRVKKNKRKTSSHK